MQKTLRRSTDDRMIGGVCGGIGRYFDIDGTLVRVAWILATLAGGSGIVAYLILWWLIPNEMGERSPLSCLLVLLLLVLPGLCLLCVAPCGFLSLLAGGGQ